MLMFQFLTAIPRNTKVQPLSILEALMKLAWQTNLSAQPTLLTIFESCPSFFFKGVEKLQKRKKKTFWPKFVEFGQKKKIVESKMQRGHDQQYFCLDSFSSLQSCFLKGLFQVKASRLQSGNEGKNKLLTYFL